MLKLNPTQKTQVSAASFGLALAGSGLEAGHLADCAELPGFDAIELPLEALPPKSARSRFAKATALLSCNAGRLMDQSVTQNMLATPKGMRDAFAAQASSLIETAKAAGFKGAVLDLGLETALDDAEARKAALQLVRAMGHALVKNAPFALSLPCRAPSLSGPKFSEKLARFISDCMIPNVKARLEIHPHELSAGFLPSESVRHLEFHLSSAVLYFNADAGNRLVKAHLTPWIEYLADFGFKGPYLLCPRSGDRKRLPGECETLSKLAVSIRNS